MATGRAGRLALGQLLPEGLSPGGSWFGCTLGVSPLLGPSHMGARRHRAASWALGSVPAGCDLYSLPSPNTLQRGCQRPQPTPSTMGREELCAEMLHFLRKTCA